MDHSYMTNDDFLDILTSMWLFVCGSFVFFMQAGFAVLEAGAVRAKNTKNILLKNMLDPSMSAAIWWAFGCPFAFGTNNGAGDAFIGSRQFFLADYKDCEGDHCALKRIPDGIDFTMWFYQWAFSAVAATIVSGAVAERSRFSAYMIYTAFITGFVYPVVVHWVWSHEGWLSATFDETQHDWDRAGKGVIDFAGSGVVHIVGGASALTGATILGPRIGRFDYDGKIRAMAGHSSALMVLGTFILWLGWYGFNAGSAFSIADPAAGAQLAGKIAVTSTLSAAASGGGTLILHVMMGNQPDVGPALNGILTGLVAICAGCATIEPWAAFIVGAISAPIYYFSSILLKRVKIDDPLDASPVHLCGGLWGVIAAGIFSNKQYTRVVYGDDMYFGLIYGGDGGKQFGLNLLAALVICAYSLATTGMLFYLLKLGGVLRVDQADEFMGMDVSYHGGSAYEWQTSGSAPGLEPPKQAGAGHDAGSKPEGIFKPNIGTMQVPPSASRSGNNEGGP